MLNQGASIDIWVVERTLGHGGMGSVYRCHNREAPRIRAAIKVLNPGFHRFTSAKARFVREAEILFSLDHPGIVKVRNVRMDGETPYLEMEFVDGADLDVRRAGPMAPHDAIPVLRQIADAMAYLHARGIRHRDVKPSNLIIQADGTIKLVDFGIASECAGAQITGAGPVFGSIAYVPPEWLDAAALDPVRWDVYSMGVVFWEYLRGHQAFPVMDAGNVHQEVVRVLRDKQRAPFLELGPNFPAALRDLIADMTRTDWRERVITAEQVRERLDGLIVDPHDTPQPTWSGRPERRRLPPDAARVRLDPSYTSGMAATTAWLEARWHSPNVFAAWSRDQLENYMLVLPAGAAPLPTQDGLRVSLSHDALRLDCHARVQAAGPAHVAYRLDLDVLQVERLRKWRAEWERSAPTP